MCGCGCFPKNEVVKIVLMRHGPSEYCLQQKQSAAQLSEAVRAYRDGGLHPMAEVPAASLQESKQCRFVVCSGLPRAQQSLNLMDISADVADDLFNESDLPYFYLPFLVMPLMWWAILFRALSTLGLTRNGESLSCLKQRALQAATQLECNAAEHESVLLMGHGLMNHFIGKSLQAHGWQRSFRGGSDHWGYSVYEKINY